MDKREKEKKAKEQLEKILKSEFFMDNMQNIVNIYDKYYKQQKAFYARFSEYYFGAESVFDHLNSNEVELWNYLYALYKKYIEKYAGKVNARSYDISLKENRGAWEILTREEQKQLAQFVMRLKDNRGTFLKYIRCDYIHSMFPKDNLYLLVSDISSHSHYISFVRAQHIMSMIQDMPDHESLLDSKTEKLYEDLKYRIKKASEICSKIEDVISQKLSDKANREIEQTAKKKKKKQIKND